MYFQSFVFRILALCFFFLVPSVLSEKVVVGYFPNWLRDRFPASKINYQKYTHIHYAFAIMVNSTTPQWTDPAHVKTQLPQVVSAAHKAKSKVLISVGGWSGSISFSTMARSASSRKSFINWNIKQIQTYKTDGVDIDWEYPGRQGAGCNVVDAKNDVKNFLTLLQELRSALDEKFGKGKKELSIAAYVQGFKTDSGDSPNSLVASIGKVLDRVNIMTYDINGAWNPQTGPNSPLKSADSSGIDFNSAIDFWVSAGVPAKKLTGGLPFYGRSSTALEDMTKTKSLYQNQVSGKPPKGDSYDTVYQDPYCSIDNGGYSGTWRFSNLISQGVLKSPTKAKKPWVRTWDSTTSTPWLFNPSTKVFISYDDPISIAAKVKTAVQKGLAGVMVWSIDEDSTNTALLNAITANLH